jgi:hypothetical protein
MGPVHTSDKRCRHKYFQICSGHREGKAFHTAVNPPIPIPILNQIAKTDLSKERVSRIEHSSHYKTQIILGNEDKGLLRHSTASAPCPVCSTAIAEVSKLDTEEKRFSP